MRALLRGMALAALAVALGLAAQGRTRGQGEPAKADIRGSITRVTPATEEAKKRGILASVLIEGAKEKETSYDKAVVRITDKTKLEKHAGKERVPAKVEDLKKGVRVQAIFTGPVAQSFPVQATARELLILEAAK